MIYSQYLRSTMIVLSVFVFAIASSAQETPKKVNGGIVNGKAVKLPIPEYPESAKAMKASGLIAVAIEIDEAGNVVSAKADLNDQRERRDVDGTKLDPLPADPSLRDAAERAAWEAKFSPTMLGGKPVRITGTLIFNFLTGEKVESVTMARLDPRSINGGVLNGSVLNGKVTVLPKPDYPPAAKAVRAEGAVSVRVLVDEEGNVTEAAAVSGHPLLRSVSEKAAMDAKFSPTFLSGKPVKISGILTFNFSLPKATDQ